MTEREIPDITPLDPDIGLITDWLAGELSDTETAKVEQRLLDDDAFWVKAGPFVKLWSLPINYEALAAKYPATSKPRVSSAAEPSSEWARATAAAIVRGAGAEPIPVATPAPAAEPNPVAATTLARLPFGERTFRFWFGWAGETKPAGPGHYWARIKYAYGTMILAALGHDRRVNAPETVIEKSPALSLIFHRVEQGLALTGLAALVLIFGLGLYSSYQRGDDSSLIRRAVHVFTRPPLTNGTKVETPPAQEIALTLPSGTRTVVRGGSRLEWNAAGVALLRGSATFEVPPDVREHRVLTDYGDVRMGPGRYALSRDGSGKLVLVSVAAGLARIRPDTTATTPDGETQLGTGEFGSLSSDGVAAKVAPKDAAEHPTFNRERVVFRSSAAPGAASSVQRWRQFSWIRVDPGARLTWNAGNPSVLHLTGEMAIVLDPRDGTTFVQTDFGDVVLNPGSHAVKTVSDSGHPPIILVSTRGQLPRIAPTTPRDPTPTESIVEWLGLESGRIPPRAFAPSDYPQLIPDSLAPRTPFGTARGPRGAGQAASRGVRP